MGSHSCGPQVVRHLDEDRAAAAGAQALEGAPHHVRQLLGRRHRLGRLGDALHGDGGEEVAVDPGHALGIAHGHHQDRHGLAIGLGDAAVGVLGAGAVLHDEHADLLAGGDAGDGVRHVQPDALLAHDDRADAGGRTVLEDVVDGIADDPLHALALQDLGNRIAGLHGSSALAIWRVAPHLWSSLPSLGRSPGSVEGCFSIERTRAYVWAAHSGDWRAYLRRSSNKEDTACSSLASRCSRARASFALHRDGPGAGHPRHLVDEGQEAPVEIADCEPADKGLCGKIVWLAKPNDEKGQPQTDRLNPNRSLRSREIVGLQLIEGWRENGPRNGRAGSTTQTRAELQLDLARGRRCRDWLHRVGLRLGDLELPNRVALACTGAARERKKASKINDIQRWRRARAARRPLEAAQICCR